MSPVILQRGFASHLLSLWLNSAEDAEWPYINPPYLLVSNCIEENVQHLFTTQSGNGPVTANAGRKRRQFEDKGPNVGVGVSVRGRDVNLGVGARALAHLGLLGYQHWRVVVHIDQVDLEGSCPAGLRRAWGEVRENRRGKRIKGGDGEIIV